MGVGLIAILVKAVTSGIELSVSRENDFGSIDYYIPRKNFTKVINSEKYIYKIKVCLR